MKNLRKLLGAFLVLIALSCVSVSHAASEVASGTCGENLTWVLTDDGVLTISGEGEMEEYSYSSKAPWYTNCGAITSVVIGDGVANIGAYAFEYCSNLTSIHIPDSVVSLGGSAFYQCSSIVSIELPDGVTEIGGYAFCGCSSLTSIDIPDGVTEIGDNVFSGCSSLTSIDIPDGVTEIGGYAFCGCSSLTSIDIPDGVTEIGISAFSGCSSLTSIDIPDGVTKISSSTFQRCSSLTSIDIPDGVTEIGISAFSGCSSLTSIEIPNSVTEIGGWAFDECSSLASIELPVSITSIGNRTFSGCSSLASIKIPGCVMSVGVDAFSGCGALEVVYYNGAEWLWSFVQVSDGNDSLLNAEIICTGPDAMGGFCGENLTWELTKDCILTINGEGTMNDYDWDSPKAPWYGYHAIIAGVVIENGVTSIGESAFDNCSSFVSVTIPVSVTNIGYDAFYACSALKTVEYGGSYLQWISMVKISGGNDCLTNATINYHGTEGISGTCGENLTWVLTDDGVLTISGEGEMDAFGPYDVPWYDYRELITTVVIEDGVTSIDDRAFDGCTALQEITIPYSVEIFGSEYATSDLFDSDVVIKGYSPSHAEYYAEKYGYGWVSFGETPPVTTVYITPADENRSAEAVEEELRAAIRSHTRVILADGVYELAGELNLVNLVNFSLEAENAGYVEILSSVCYEPVIDLSGSLLGANKITLYGLILGHDGTDFDVCSSDGYVIRASSSKDLVIQKCDLWGCGIVATKLDHCDRVTVSDSILRDCTECAVSLGNCQEILYENCVISGNRYDEEESTDYPCVNMYGDSAASFRNCRFFNNRNTALVSEDGQATFTDCDYRDNSWQDVPIQYYGVYGNTGLTWQAVPLENGKYDLYLGHDIVFADGTMIEGGTGIFYHDASRPWKRLKIADTIIADGVTIFGTDGENTVWTLTGDGTLTISGAETTENYKWPSWSTYCKGIINVMIEDGVTSIGYYAFSKCTNLTSIAIPDSVTSIGNDAFDLCASLASITIPDSVISIGANAFWGCTSLTSITIPDGVISIGANAFWGCTSLTSITIPDGVAELGDGVFVRCGSLTEIIVDENNSNYSSVDGVLFDKEQTVILCYPASKATTYTIPDSVTVIARYAFYECINLSGIEIPDSVTSIGSSAFSGCSSLVSVEIPNSVTELGERAFSGCSSLASIEIPGGVKNILSGAFDSCYELTSIVLPASIVNIGEDAFRGCYRLTTVYYAGTKDQWNAVEIGADNDYLLNANIIFNSSGHTHTLGEVVYTWSEDNTQCTAEGVCTDCGETVTETVTATVETNAPTCTVDGYAVYIAIFTTDGFDEQQKTVEIPATGHTEEIIPGKEPTLTEPGLTEGKKCSVCGEILVEQEQISMLEEISGICGENLTWTLTKDGVLTISGTGAMFHFTLVISPLSAIPMSGDAETAPWSDYTSLITKVVVEDGVTSIGDNAFAACENLKEIEIPETVTAIGDNVFSGCEALETVTYSGSEEQWNEIAIGEGNETLEESEIVTVEILLGDVNGDGKINGTDTNLIFRHVSGTTVLSGDQLKAADVNGDGKINGTDTNLVFRFVSGTLDSLG